MVDFSVVDSFVLDKISETKIPSIAFAVIRDGELIYAKAFGFRDLENLLPASPETMYGVGSVTKSFTALAIMKLAEEGKLSVDDPITKYLNIRFNMPKGEITIHNLLTHSSGIPALAYAEAYIDSLVGAGGRWLPITRDDDVLTFMDPDVENWIISEPGKRFFYLNEGYVMLGKIIAKVSGKPYEKFVTDEILKPLKMKRSCFKREKVEELGNFAAPYLKDREGNIVRGKFPFGVTADGGLISTVLDLTKYIQMYLNNGMFDGKEILGKEYVELMLKPHIREPYLDEDVYYGYGWSIRKFLGNTLVSHSGSVLVHTAYVGFIPERKVGVAILANSSGYPLSQIGEYILAYVLGENPNALSFVKREKLLDKLVGTYETYKGTMKVRVERNGDFLVIVMESRYWISRTILVPQKLEDDHAVFYTLTRGRKLPVEFIINGRKVELIYERYLLRKV